MRFGGNARIGNSGIGTIDAPFLASFVFRSAWPQSGTYNRIFTNSGATNCPSLAPVSGTPGSLLLRGHLSATPTATIAVPADSWTSVIIQFNGATTRVKSGAAAPVPAPLAAGILTGIRIGGQIMQPPALPAILPRSALSAGFTPMPILRRGAR